MSHDTAISTLYGKWIKLVIQMEMFKTDKAFLLCTPCVKRCTDFPPLFSLPVCCTVKLSNSEILTQPLWVLIDMRCSYDFDI